MATTTVRTEDWARVVQRSRRRRQWSTGFLYGFLTLASLPIIIPYFWLVTLAFSARGGTDTVVLWRTLAVVAPAVLIWALLGPICANPAARRRARLALLVIALAALAIWIGPSLHLDNWRFLWNPAFSDTIKDRPTGAGLQFPNVWDAFANSLILAVSVMVIVVLVATLAGYYLSRFAFAGRAGLLKSLLVLYSFPAMTLVIPIFLLMYWTGLLDTLFGVILVVATLELPFAIFIMKGFFDAVPWDIEMSAMTDGASRRQVFVLIVLPQVRFGMLAVGHLRLPARLGGLCLRPHASDRQEQLGHEPLSVLRVAGHHGRGLRHRHRRGPDVPAAGPGALYRDPEIPDPDDLGRNQGLSPMRES